MHRQSTSPGLITVRDCAVCGTNFSFYTSQRAATQGRTCSRACAVVYSRGKIRRTLTERFWSKVNKDGPVPSHVPSLGTCWVWTAGRYRSGYGSILANGKPRYAHRVSWEINVGPIPEGLHILHRCDTPPCVRPDHLFAGTVRENALDMVSKGRHAFGAEHPSARLTWEQADKVRRRHADGATYAELAREYGVVDATIKRLVLGLRYRS